MTQPIDPLIQQELHDLANIAAINHRVDMTFHPDSWSRAAQSHFTPTWFQVTFPPEGQDRSNIPKQSGVYIFVVKANIFNFPYVSGFFYVGKATNLYERIAAYIGEINRSYNATKRPSVWRMINSWHGYLQYFYTVTPDVATAEAIEDEMISLIQPPFNTQYSGTLSKARRAF